MPLGPRVGKGGVETPAALTVNIFPGADGSFALYEDDHVLAMVCYRKGANAIKERIDSLERRLCEKNGQTPKVFPDGALLTVNGDQPRNP